MMNLWMEKRTYFAIGFFAALLLSASLGAGAWAVSGELFEYIFAALFGAILGVILLISIVLLFRGRIERALWGRAEATLGEVSEEAIAVVSATIVGDRPSAEAHAKKLGQLFAGWYSWVSFHRWAIGTAIALLVAFGAFAGTTLLYEQNHKLAEQVGFMRSQTELMENQTKRLKEQTEAAEIQNEIMTLTLVNQLREQMIITSETITLGELWKDSASPDSMGRYIRPLAEPKQCGLALVENSEFRTPPNAATLGAIEDLARKPRLGERIVRALQLLTLDRDDVVAFGSLMVLDRMGVVPNPSTNYGRSDFEKHHFKGLYIDAVKLSEAQRLFFSDSAVYIDCENCTLDLFGSIGAFYHADRESSDVVSSARSTASDSLIVQIRSKSTIRDNTISWLSVGEDVGENSHKVEVLSPLTTLIGVLESDSEDAACNGLFSMARDSRLFSYVDARADQLAPSSPNQ